MASKAALLRTRCGDKVAFASEHEAKRAALRLNRRSRIRMTTYRCWYCHQFHIAHKERRP